MSRMIRAKKRSIPVIAFVLLLFLIWTCLFVERKDDCFEAILAGPILPNNSALIETIKKKFLIEPSHQPYNLLGRRNIATKAIESSQKFYRNASNIIFGDKTNGFFIEAGALDGETMSNTLFLEAKQNWTGLLVEPDPVSFKALKNKNRKVWLSNVGLSPVPYPIQKLFETQSQYVDADSGLMGFGFKMRAMNGLPDFTNKHESLEMWHFYVQCLPLESLLYAIGIYEVDLLSLDVEGPEMKILENFPFSKFAIHVIYTEWKLQSSFAKLSALMTSKGYGLYDRRNEDSIFIKIGSPYDR